MSLLSTRLLSHKASQLRHAAFLLGISSTGTKTELSAALEAQLISSSPAPKAPNRIVSIDMGIKNLGICVLEPKTRKIPTSSKLEINIVDWRRMDLLSHPASSQAPTQPTQFSPSTLSTLAVQTATSLLSTYNPSTILLERQRFRSGGAAAVQEWTLRVNMLESMLWASLECLRTHLPSRPSTSRTPGWDAFPQTFEVLPARVANFWCNPPEGLGTEVPGRLFDGEQSRTKKLDGALTASEREEMLAQESEDDQMPLSPSPSETGKKGKKNIDKKEKIAVVRSWLSESSSNPTPRQKPHHNIDLELAPAVQTIARAFSQGEGRDRPRGMGKLDDLADSLLQGVAWVRWRENERVMREMLRKEIEDARVMF